MNLDLNNLLKDWPHEPGKIKARKIVGMDGRAKLQLRVDLGIIQMEMEGRPDGLRPHDAESLLIYQQRRAAKAEKKGNEFLLTPQECSELQQEGIQYYHRYLSLFQIEDFQAVLRDTTRNLELFDFVTKHTDREDIVWSFQQFRPYVLMMSTRARAALHLERESFQDAISEIESGKAMIEEFIQSSPHPENLSGSPELAFLGEWLDEIQQKRPVTQLEAMQRDLKNAIDLEAYERAAEIRDAINSLGHDGKN